MANCTIRRAARTLSRGGGIKIGVKPEGMLTMPHIIAEPCIGTKDTSCVDACPVDCIHPTKDEPDFETADQLYIDPDTCIDCGLCVDECPVQAIYQDEDLPEEWSRFVQINIDYYNK